MTQMTQILTAGGSLACGKSQESVDIIYRKRPYRNQKKQRKQKKINALILWRFLFYGLEGLLGLVFPLEIFDFLFCHQ